MSAGLTLIGRVGRDIIRSGIDRAHQDHGTARFVLYGLEPAEMVAIVLAIQDDKGLCRRLDICLPAYAFAGVEGIAPEHLTDINTTDLRHAKCDKEARLLVLLDESQAQSLSQVDPIDAGSLLSLDHLDLWFGHSGAAAEIPDSDRAIQWRAAIRALMELDRVSMRQFADYLVAVAANLRGGNPLPAALGAALPKLHLPRFDQLFDDISPARRGHYSQWRARFLAHWKRDCYIYKRDQSQTPFSTARLREKLDGMSSILPGDVYAVLAAYVEAPPGIGPASFAPFELDWPDVRQFFEEAQRADSKSIGSETRAFYKLAREDRLTHAEWRYLDDLADERGRNPSKDERDEEFYSDHIVDIRHEPRLAALWDRFIFGPEVPCTDLIEGLLQCVRRLYRPGAPGRQILVVEAVEDEKRAFLSLNEDICAMFAARYRGLEAALEGLVSFRRVLAFRHDSFVDEIASRRRSAQSTARKSRQLRFKVRVEEEATSGASVRLVWEGSLDAVGIGLASDLERLRDNKSRTTLVRCSAGYRQRARATQAGINMRDLSGLDPAAQRNRGSFVPSSSRCESLALDWRRALADARKAGVLEMESADRLAGAFDTFERSYEGALADWASHGLRSPSLAVQAQAYGALIDTVCASLSSHPMVIEGLLRPLFEIGVAPIQGVTSARSSVIVCPWHPLRLEALNAQLAKFRRALEALFAPQAPEFADGGTMFFDELSRNLRNPARPDITMTWPSAQAILISEVDTLHGYSLLERPVTRAGADAPSNENVLPTARQIADLAQVYLQLQPHERDNLSIVLFNCDAAALPQAVVDAVRKDAEREGEEAMCQVILRHTDGKQLRALYQQLVNRELQQDGLHASEAARDFMSRLRISILVNEQRPSQSSDGPPFDIVFCHDVISRQAELGWSDVPRIERPAIDIDPAQWSRRKAIGRFDRDAVLHLTCPAQTKAGWSYLDAVAVLADAGLALAARDRGLCRVPDRRTVLQSDETRQVLDETHRLGAWVVNFDDLLDRRQLLNSGISVIRYKHAAGSNRSLIISSKASDTLLRATLCSRLRGLDASYDAETAGALAGRLINDANSVSGDIVLRAARRGTSAGELIGVVLSKYLVDRELGHRPRAWLFLDDYASWLGQAEGRMADLLCLAPSIDVDGNRYLDVIVTEAKFVSTTKLRDKADHSQGQLKASLRRFEKALSAEGEPADAAIWRARLAEMLQDAQRDGTSLDPNWRIAIRDGKCTIRVAGYSHVFSHGFGDAEIALADHMTGVEGTRSGYQERFAPATVREIVKTYADNRDPTPLRLQLGATLLAETLAARLPVTQASAVPGLPLDRPTELVTPRENGEAERTSAHAQDSKGSEFSEGSKTSLSFQALLELWAQDRPSQESDTLWLDDTAQRCRAALLRYGMSARLEQQVLTPNAALLRFRGSDDLTVAKVENKREELESTHGLELIGVRAEPGFVVVSIKRPHRMTLGLPEVWAGWKTQPEGANAKLLIAVKEDDGTPLFLEPEPAPHTLVAGSTGSGKSILIQNIILGIAATNRPDQSRIILIDPKAGVDYFAFETLPHLDGPIIDREDVALTRLDELVVEMQRRYSLFKEARVSNITAYNKATSNPLPLLWLIHDEFADWMQLDTYRAGVEAVVNRLGIKARAAGIYLIFAAQRPDASVFPMQLRSNLGNRLILRVDSAGTSDLSLGVKGGGAERLLGKGHLAAIIGGGTTPIYAQVPFIDTDRLEQLVAALVRGLG
ncbi:FtsK/SpoIIIE domain-containing protein [Mesorhizobium sp. B2-3-6]|uniref:FtsK/SpoIIIE domain-containing protein n=1 Tax=Mesorhizobium sp. B2-3-6 TaxID=2589957 RepID=UPI001128C0F0|nr:FtsK/SpoIIIE domain-containing protein [Mesorhizobium sp. B2-3-6]TPM23828.1 DNA translocase FtsK [Mesorhizobium sp. B2-3-6]